MSVLREYGEGCPIEDREAGRLKIRYNTQEIPTTHTLRKHMKAYHDLMRHVLDNGIDKSDRTGTGTRSVFGYQMRFDLSEGFPLLTTKNCICARLFMSCFGFLKAIPTSNT